MRGFRNKDLTSYRLIWAAVGLCLLCLPRFALALTATTTTLTLSSASQASGTALTLTAAVVAGATPVTLGTVVFCNASATYCMDSAVVGTAQLTSSGKASIKIIPSIGSHSYKAIFRATGTYATSTSASSSMTVTGTFSTTTAISSSGSAGSYTLTGTVVSTGSPTVSPTGTVSFTDSSNANYALGSATLGSGVQSQTFTSPGTGPSATTARELAFGDFNGDGIPDLVVGSQTGGSITVLLGNGDGTFTAASGSPITVTSGDAIVGIAAGDFNNDGKTDMIAADYTAGQIAIFLGNGDGTFQTTVLLSVTAQLEEIKSADFNNDGNLDLVVASQFQNNVTVLLGDGTGAFPTSHTYSTGSQPYSLGVADLDGDGNIDIVAGNLGASSVTVLLGDGTGHFAAATGSPVAAGTNPSIAGLAVGDFNGDGKPDMVVADSGASTLSILIGNGNGTFQTATTTAAASGTKYIAAADFDRDGKLDLAVLDLSTVTLSIYIGNGDGTFKTPVSMSTGFSGQNPNMIAAADLDGDGYPDVAFPLFSLSNATVFLNKLRRTATASLGPLSIPGSGSHNVAAAYAGDANDAASTSSTISLTASKISTSIALSAAPSSSSYGQQVVLTGTLSPYSVGGLTTNGETIAFYNGATSLGTGTLSSGVASLNVTSLPYGTDSLTAVYTTDANFLGSTSSALSYTVSMATPTVTWATPSAITYGTALSGTQLNATSGGVAGSFVYSPASGTVLGAGSQTLNVTFTPTDTTDYNTATGSVTLTVNQAAKTITFPQPTTPVTVGAKATLGATASNGDAVTYTVTSGTATISGSTITYTNTGTVTIAANSSATTNYSAAAMVSDSVTVNAAASVYTAPATNVGATSATQTATVNFTAAGTLNTISVLSQGVSGLDYTFVAGGTCATGTAYTVGQACTVTYTFNPKYPGQRIGAVSLTTSTSQLLGASYLVGSGLGPLLALTPAVVSTVAGTGSGGYSGDGGAATSAQISSVYRAIRDTVGNTYIADVGNARVRKVTASTGKISTVAGNGSLGFSGDGGAATSAQLSYPSGIGIDALGNIYISENGNCRIRKVTVATGIITTVVGTGTCGYSGDNGLATSAAVNNNLGDIIFDAAGNFYFADQSNARVREVNISTGVITTIAGTGTAGFSGDGGAATSAKLNNPNDVAFDVSGNLYVCDQNNNRIREVNVSTGVISTVAGNGSQSFSGDGGAATSAALNQPYGATVDVAGNIYIADSHNNRVRMVSAATGNISTIAGNGSSGFGGDGGSATLATFNTTADVSLDGAGNLLIDDASNNRMRLITVASGPSIAFSSTAVGTSSAANNETVSNIGSSTLTLASVSVPANFSLGGAATTCATSSQTLASGVSCVLGLEFAPTSVGSLNGNITLTDNPLNVAGTTQMLALSGTGTADSTSTAVTSSANPSTYLGSVTFTATVSNTSGAASTPTGTVQFSIDGSNVGGTMTLSGGAATYTTTSLTGGTHSVSAAYVSGSSNFSNSTSSSLTQTVNKATPTVTWGTPSAITYGTALSGTQLNASSGGVAGTFVYSPVSGTVLGAGSQTLNVTFTPTDTTDYNTATGSVTLVVNKATPTVTWGTPSAITYGTALSGTQLNATSGGAAGTFVYTPASGTILSAGNGQTLSVAFTPTDTTDYNTASGSTTINVTKASGTISLGTSAASSTYGSPVTLTATLPANAIGTVTILDGGVTLGTGVISGTTATLTTSSLAVGSHSLTATWPGDTNYTSATSTVLTQTIVRAAATVSELSSRNPSLYGDTVTLTVSVSGSGATPTGMVVIKDGAATLATVTLTAGSASFSTSALVAGSHTLAAIYQGDTNYF